MKAIAHISWKVAVLLCLGYIAYSLHLMNGGVTLRQVAENFDPTHIEEEPASSGVNVSFDSLYPEAAEQAMKLHMESDAAKGLRNK